MIIYEKIEPKVKNDILSNYNYKEKAIKKYYSNLKLIKSETKVKLGYCYNYVFNDYSNLHIFSKDIYDYLTDHYRHINLEKIKKGDVVTIHNDIDPNECNVKHYAKIIKTDNTIRGTTIRSKWGIFGIWQGNIEDIPDIYGNYILFWRKK